MHGSRGTDDELMSEMNFIPLIDIALTLVIILMVTTAFIRLPGVSLKLPETVTREGAPETNKDLTIVVAKDGTVYIDGEAKNAGQVRAHLMAIAARDRKARILVKGDRAVVYGKVMEVMDLVRQAGLTRVVLPTDPKPVDPTPAERDLSLARTPGRPGETAATSPAAP